MRLSAFIMALMTELNQRGDGEVHLTWEGTLNEPYTGPADYPGGQEFGFERDEYANLVIDCEKRIY